jgi:hypothetical protein
MANLAAYRTRISNSLNDTATKYSNDILDEALRKVLNEYARAFPNISTQEITISTAGRPQSLSTCTNLISVIQLVHPWNAGLADPFVYEREDYMITWQDGSPAAYFTGQDIPQAGEKIFVKYAGKQTIESLDSATLTTVRDDHEDLLIVGAAGQAAMIRASGLNEAWGVKSGEMSQLMVWGNNQYNRFLDFLAEVRTEQSMNIFPETYWKLDQWDDQ